MIYSTYSYPPPPPAKSLVNRAAISTLTGLVLMILYSHIHTANAQTPQNFGQGYFDSLYVGTPVCGDLHGYMNEAHQDYVNFRTGQPSTFKSREDWDPAAVFECGPFTLYYEDFVEPYVGHGFAHPIHGEIRRNTLCDVLTYVSSILQINGNPTIRVKNSYESPVLAASDFDFYAFAKARPTVPIDFGTTSGIYEGNLFNHATTGIDPDILNPFDAELTVNFDLEWYVGTVPGLQGPYYLYPSDDINNQEHISSMNFDFFTLMLHEVTHMLGMMSSLMEAQNGNIICSNSGNSFFKFDSDFGFHGEIQDIATFNNKKLLLENSGQYLINPNVNLEQFPLRSAKVWLSNEGPPNNHNVFAGFPSLLSFPQWWIDSFIDQLGPSFLSHLGPFYWNMPYRQQYSPGRYINYLMEPTLYFQEIVREWTLPEIRILLQLGYSLNSQFAIDQSLSFPYLNAAVINNSPPFRTDYNDPLWKLTFDWDDFSFADENDFIENTPPDFEVFNSNTEQIPLVSQLFIPLGNDDSFDDVDGDVIRTKSEWVFGLRGVSNGQGNTHSQVVYDESSNSFIYTPMPGFYGRAEFGFFLFDGKEMGALEIYSIDVLRDQDIVYPNTVELVINGNFEDGMEVKTWDNPEKIVSYMHTYNQPLLSAGARVGGGHFPGISYASPIIMNSFDDVPGVSSFNIINQYGDYGSYIFTAPLTVPDFDLAFQFFTAPYPDFQLLSNSRFLRMTFGQEFVSRLVDYVIPGEFYELKFKYAVPIHSNGNSSLNIGDEIPFQLSFSNDNQSYFIQQIDPVSLDQIVPISPFANWSEATFNFQYCGDAGSNFLKFIHNLVAYVYIDDFSLKKDLNPEPLEVNAGPDIFLSSLCQNSQIPAELLSERCQLSISWTPTTGLSDPTILNPIASPTQTTTYTITVTDLLTGEVATDQITVYVNEVVESNGPITICYTDPPVDLTNHVSITGGEFYVQYNGQTLLENNIFDPADFVSANFNTVYTITYIVGEAPCLSSTAFIITVQGNTSNATHPNGLNATTGTTTLTGNLQFLEDLTIQFGATVTINGGATVKFAEGKGIIVMPGGKLNVLSNSLLTNIDCDPHWLGIRVGGIPSLSQTGADANQQGFLNLRNSEVRNAIIGAANYLINTSTTGGRIFTLGATFKNCRRAVHLQNYANIHPTTGAILPIRCEFYNSNFIWDENFQFINETSNPMMGLSSVHRVAISGCKFTNTNTGLFGFPNNHPNKCAILGRSASIVLSRGCSGEPPYAIDQNGNCTSGNVASTIEGFNYGVYLVEGSLSSITNTTFRCYRGLWDFSSNVIQITQNTFTQLPAALLPFMTVPPTPFNPYWPIPYGAYLEFTTGFWMEANTFSYTGISNEAGLIIKSSGDPYHQVYDNNFNSTRFGVIAYDDNRGLNQNSGLKIECNTFSQNNRGIIVFPTTTAPPSGWGISHTQGMPAQGTDDPFPAGNYFTTTTSSVQNNLDFVTYYRHASEMVPPAIGQVFFPPFLTDPNGCPSSFGGGLFEKGLMASTHKNTADSIGNVLSVMIDDGNTEALTDEVIYADYVEAVELYYDLMQVSPNLSEEVMIEAIKKEYELPAALLTLILSSNPHAAKSEKLQRELDERLLPLSEYQRDMINQGLDLVSYKEGLEARESYHRTKYSALIDQLVIEAMGDTSGTNLIGEIENIITGYETPEYAYLLTELYLRAGSTTAAQNQLNQIAVNFELDTRKNAEYLDYQAVYGVLIELANSGDTVLTPAQKDMLEEIAYKHSTRAAGLAAVTLSEYTNFLLLETLVEPVDAAPKSNRSSTKDELKIKFCKVYPNPTAGILLVEIPAINENVSLRMIDGNGKLIYDGMGTQGLNTINLRKSSSGNYQLSIYTQDGKLSETHSIQIAK